MRIFWLFCALGALLGCRQVSEPSGTAIALFCSTSEQSKTDILTVGEEVAVFACPEGTEDYFLEAAKFTVGADGRSLNYGSTVYYPDPKQAVRFLAYFPYHTGTFSVPTDQSTAKALKEADLCGATASSTPVATPVALEFRHLMAKVVITQTNKPTEKITFPNAVTSGVLHAATAELVLGAERKDISTTGNELIVPVQPLSRLVLTVSGVEYVFDTAPIALEAGKTTTLNLTLHPDTHTATLSGSSVTDWVASSTTGNITQAVSNVLTIHWAPNAHTRSTEVDQVVFTIDKVDHTVSKGISYGNQTFTVPFDSTTLRYPYTIQKISFYKETELIQSCTDLLGAVVYKSGASTVGIKDPANAIRIDDLWWATGNLVATNAVAGARGLGGCKIGAPEDYGLYFQFGSLIGWTGGASGNGVGQGSPILDKAVWPIAMGADIPNYAWPNKDAANTSTLSDKYFNYSIAPWDANNTSSDIGTFAVAVEGQGSAIGTLRSGRYANLGVGDPCSYYLGVRWRTPIIVEWLALLGEHGDNTNKQVPLKMTLYDLSFSASGDRYRTAGGANGAGIHGSCGASSIFSAEHNYNMSFFSGNVVYPLGIYYRSLGLPIRCVSN